MSANLGTYGGAFNDLGDYDYIQSGVNPFSFDSVFGATRSTVYESNIETITGFSSPFDISITGGEYRIDGGAYTSANGSIASGQTVQIRLTSSANYSTVVTSVLNIDGTIEGYSVFTEGDPNAKAEGSNRLAIRLGLGL